MLARQLVLRAVRQPRIKHSKIWHIRSRQFSSQTSTSTAATSPASTPTLAAITSELDKLAPRIDIQADQVQVLEGPKEFYATLKNKLRNAKERIYLATLYVGKNEHELMDCIREALKTNSKLRVSILTDALRGTREEPSPSCASLLATLAAEFPSQVEIRMYHTPNLTGIKKSLVPKRINEGWGLQHMKLYGIDDEVILSGANLSDDYFTNRQDRYHVFSSKAVSDYFQRIFSTMCSVSMLLEPVANTGAFKLTWPEGNACKSPLDDPQGYSQTAKKLFADYIKPQNLEASKTNTSIYPLLIIPNALNNELLAIQTLLATPVTAPSSSSWLFTAGYFNPHPVVTSALLAASSGPSPTKGTVVTASPWANGFYGSKGISGMLPAAYTLLSRRFLKEVEKQSAMVDLREWRLGTVGRPHGWTYHAKGLWLTFGAVGSKDNSSQAPAGPSVTIIGSSNYTVRSYSLDTEAGAVVVTTDPSLQARLKAEQDNLLQHTTSIGEKDLQGGERRVGLAVRLAMWTVKAVGGSL